MRRKKGKVIQADGGQTIILREKGRGFLSNLIIGLVVIAAVLIAIFSQLGGCTSEETAAGNVFEVRDAQARAAEARAERDRLSIALNRAARAIDALEDQLAAVAK